MDADLRFETELTIDDWRAHTAHVAAKIKEDTADDRRRVGRQTFLAACAAGVLVGFGWSRWGRLDISGLGFGVTLMFALVAVLAYFGTKLQRLRTGAAEPMPGDPFLGRRTHELTQDGMHSTSALGESTLRWTAFRSVHETPGHLFLDLGRTTAIVVPKRGDVASLAPDIRRLVEARTHAARRATGAS